MGSYGRRAAECCDHRKHSPDYVVGVTIFHHFCQALDSIGGDVLVELPGCFLNVRKAKRTGVLRPGNGMLRLGNRIVSLGGAVGPGGAMNL
jgi:hypothetical protein